MLWFCVRRLGELVVALLVASVVIFALLRLLPGDLAGIIGGVEATPERLAAIREELGLNRPLSPSTSSGWAACSPATSAARR